MRKKPTTPRSRVKAAMRQLWLRSRERQAALKKAGRCCERCGVKASTAKGHEQKLEVHHVDGINWDGLVDMFIRRVLPSIDRLEVLCPQCHDDEHHREGM